MRFLAVAFIALVAGLGIGMAAAESRTPDAPTGPPLDTVAIMQVRNPGSGDAWAREIQTHAAQLRAHRVLDTLMDNPEVRATAWFRSLGPLVPERPDRDANTNPHLAALDSQLRVWHSPGSALLYVWFDVESRHDAVILVRALARAFSTELESDRSQRFVRRYEIFRRSLESADLQLADLATALASADSDSRRSALLEQRRTLERHRSETFLALQAIQVERLLEDEEPFFWFQHH